MSVLELAGLTTGYAGVPIVRGLDLHVDAGEVVVLFGPNGAGKTTTLLAASGLLPIMGGSITVLGEPVDTTNPYRNARRGIAHVPEDRGLFFDLTVAENLRLGAPSSSRADAQAALDRATSLFPRLGALHARRAGLLSGGEQQMLAVARALVSNPRLLVIDEMSMGLAPLLIQELLPVLREVANMTEAGILLVEQHVHMALAIADRGYLMSRGLVVHEGPASELVDRPDLLAAAYLGDQAL